MVFRPKERAASEIHATAFEDLVFERADAATRSQRHRGAPVKPSTDMVPERCWHY